MKVLVCEDWLKACELRVLEGIGFAKNMVFIVNSKLKSQPIWKAYTSTECDISLNREPRPFLK